MTTNITLNKTFKIELEDNTIINVMVCLRASTEDDDEDFEANQRIRSFTYDNVIEPLEDALTELFTAEDMADSLGTGGSADADEYESSLLKEEIYQKDQSIEEFDLDTLTATPDE